MRKLLLTAFTLFVFYNAFSQDLVNARTSSFHTFIYKISDREAKIFYKQVYLPVELKNMHTLVDFFPSDSAYEKKLPLGHYLFIKTEGNQLRGEVVSVNNLDMTILTNNRDLMLKFNDKEGNELVNLTPRIKGHAIRFDSKLNVYRRSKSNKQGFISVVHNGHLNLFEIKRKYNNNIPNRFTRAVLGTAPFGFLFSPITYSIRSIRDLIRYRYAAPPGIFRRIEGLFESKNYSGYAVLNKPIYKPGDTVKLKGFFVTKKGKPISKELEVYISNYSPRVWKKLGTVSPYTKGGYVFEFVLSDSLKLSLDKEFTLYFHDKRFNSYPSADFRLEQYELKQNSFSLSPSPTNKLQKPASILLKGTDSNDLPLYDVRTSILVKPTKVNDFYEKKIFVPQTLWAHELKLEPLGDTKLTLPDSIFPNASLSYDVVATFTNAENEYQVKTLDLSYDPKEIIEFELKNDSILIPKKDEKAYRLVLLSAKNDTLANKHVTLPHWEKIQTYATQYQLLLEKSVMSSIYIPYESDQLEVMAERTKDSLFVITQNPRKLNFVFQLFRNNRIIQQGSSDHLLTRIKANPSDRYYLSVQYVWAGTARNKNFDLLFAKKPLSITIDHPSSVFPGQSVEVTLGAKDAFGKPIENVDLTAYAITKKFGNVSGPTLPSFEYFKGRKVFNEFSRVNIKKPETLQRLQYDLLKKRFGLDSLAYYDFIYPKGLFVHYAAADDSITQIAPFIFKDGRLQSVRYIYFDKELKYYGGVESIEPYSFRTNFKIKQITIRLYDKSIVIKDPPVKKGQKLILSLDLDKLPEGTQSIKQKAFLTDVEIRKLKPHFMLVNRKYNQSNSYLQQENDFHLLAPYGSYSYWNSQLVGPFFSGMIKFQSDFDLSFSFKPWMTYSFESNMVDRESAGGTFNKYGMSSATYPNLKDQVLTKRHIDNLWTRQRQISYKLHKFPDDGPVGVVGSLTIRDRKSLKKNQLKLANFILNLNNPDEFYIFPPNMTDFAPLTPGLYQCIVVYTDSSYSKPQPLRVEGNGKTYYDITDEPVLPADQFSNTVIEKINRWSTESVYLDLNRRKDMQEIKKQYYSPNYTGPGRWLSGVVTSTEDGSPLPGVNVVIKGTVNGTSTGEDGYYRIFVPDDAELVFSFIGLQTKEFSVGGMSQVDVSLTADVQQLNEIVVTAGGMTVQRRSLGNQSTVLGGLSGKVPGLLVSGAPGKADSVSIVLRGARTMADDNKALVVIDGVVGRLGDVDKNKIVAIEVLSSAQAVALYGSRAANGVILISTKPGVTRADLLKSKLPELPQFASLDENIPGSSLRKNFRDYAFWQPKLRTDENGVAKFTTTYPDDITGWNIQVLGMANKKRSGQTSTMVQSFKPLVAQLSQPNFLLVGDTAQAIGKITNYTADSLTVLRTLTINGAKVVAENRSIKNSVIDSVSLIGVGDSLATQFEIEYNKYRDGELRKIPVLPVGTTESVGMFTAMTKDTTFTLHFNKGSNVTIHAQADMIDVLLEEINHVKIYPYDCNEQLASKLKALLSEKTIRDYKKEKFAHDRLVEKIIKKLIANQAKDGSWSWWGTTGGTCWITLHVAEALDWAEKLKYRVTFDRNNLIEFLKFPGSIQFSPEEQLKAWIYLSKFGERVSAKSMVDTLAKSKKLYNNYFKMLAMRLLQLNGQQPDWKWLEDQRHETIKGNIYWGEEKSNLYNNDIDNSILAYQIFEQRDPDDKKLFLIRNYFLEKRKLTWRNTFESSRIIETLLPSIQKSAKYETPFVQVTGDQSFKIDAFPFERKLQQIENITVKKSGSSPVYFTAYETKWNPAPEKVESDFSIQSTWSDHGGKLKAGKPVSCKITVRVKRDAEYVMINVPIPAGCSYENKNQSYANGEVHREYDFHETRIYCERLKAGTYEYTVNLTPRYKGKYRVNPAKAEWMYFPVFFGREQMKNVEIH